MDAIQLLMSHRPPFFCKGHGEDDLIIKLEWARRAAEVLRPRSESLEFKTYKDVGHMISDMQVNKKRAGYVVCPRQQNNLVTVEIRNCANPP